MSEPKYCEKCTHTHVGDFCRGSHCEVCGLSGDLTTMSCEESQITIKRVEALILEHGEEAEE